MNTLWSRVAATARSALLLGAAGTVLVQILVQGMGFASAVLVVRWTTQEQYALYTLGLSLLGALTALADSGVAANVMSQGGRVWRDRVPLGGVLAAGNHIRKRLGIAACAVVLPAALAMTMQKFASAPAAFASVLAVLLAFMTYLPATVLEVPLKLHQDLQTLLKFRLLSSVFRLTTTVAVTLIAPFAWAVILAAAFAQGVSNYFLKAMAARYADLAQQPSQAGLKEMYSIVRRTLPGTIFFSVQAQATLWLLAILGVATSVAELGALGRLAAVTAVATVVFDTVIVPRFSRLPVERVRAIHIRILMGSIVFLAMGATVSIAVTPFALGLLGNQYLHLEYEFFLLCLASAVGLLSSFMWALNAARAYVPPWYVYPVTGTSFYIMFCMIFGVSTLSGALHVQLGGGLASLLTNLLVFGLKSRQELVRVPE